jgi:hypothetical protein
MIILTHPGYVCCPSAGENKLDFKGENAGAINLAQSYIKNSRGTRDGIICRIVPE